MNAPADADIRRDAILASAAEQFRALLETHFAQIVRAAEDSFVGDEIQEEPIAKAAVAVEWSALTSAPKVAVRLSWSVKYKDESEAEIDPLQAKLGLENLDAADKVIARRFAKNLRESGAAVTIRTGGKPGVKIDASGIHKEAAP